MPEPVFYRPAAGYVGDVIPYTHDGEFWLFFLHDLRDSASGTGWRLVKTRDFVTFADGGIAVPAGDVDDPDRNAYTGSVVITDDAAHLFYTGQNPRVRGEDGAPVQLVMHAVSKDGMGSWNKDPGFALEAPEGYATSDWRDPFVFRDGPDGQWRMLITGRHNVGPERRRGVIAQCVSDDLSNWRLVQPFWDPARYVAMECPDVFEWGAWWYLVYSEFSERFATRYRMARSLDGPWQVPELDSVDGRAFYAAKSTERDGRRFFVGWMATKASERDDGEWEWAGDLSVLEACQRSDGSLDFMLPDEIASTFRRRLSLYSADGRSEGPGVPGATFLQAPDGFRVRVFPAALPSQFLAQVSVDIHSGTTECGLLIRGSPDGDEGYYLRLEPQRRRMVFDRWPRRLTGPMQWQVSGDVPFEVELERPCRLDPGLHKIDLLVDGTALVAVLDGSVALSARIYDRTAGHLGVFVGEGAAAFHGISVSTKDQ